MWESENQDESPLMTTDNFHGIDRLARSRGQTYRRKNRELIQGCSLRRAALIRGLMTDDEWAYFEPFLIHRGGGRPPRNHRRVLDAVFWLMRTARPAGGLRQLEIDL